MYIISDRLKFIFFHTPKTGGASMYEALKKYGIFICRQRDFFIRNLRKIILNNRRIGIYEYHISASLMKSTFDPGQWTAYFKFGFVRNPYRWLVSYYHFIRSTRTHKRYSGFQAYDDINQFVQNIPAITPAIPVQKNYLTDANDNLLVDFVGRYENLNADFQVILNRLNLSGQVALPHINQSVHPELPETEIFTPSSLDIIHDYFDKDFSIFNYKKIKAS